MKKLFIFNLHSIVDIITNSSSELFVFQENTLEAVKSLIERMAIKSMNIYL